MKLERDNYHLLCIIQRGRNSFLVREECNFVHIVVNCTYTRKTTMMPLLLRLLQKQYRYNAIRKSGSRIWCRLNVHCDVQHGKFKRCYVMMLPGWSLKRYDGGVLSLTEEFHDVMYNFICKDLKR